MTIGSHGAIEQIIRLVKHKVNAHGRIIHPNIPVAEFPNLITDFGLNFFGGNSAAARWCQIGTGTTTPSFGDTGLVARVASSQTEDPSNRSQGIVAGPPRYSFHTSMRRFAAGSFAGQALAEIGFGSTSTGQLWNRALIRDGGGSPTTITILADEILDAYLETRIYIPTGDQSPVIINLGGVDYTFTGRVIRNAVLNSSGGNNRGWGLPNDPNSMNAPIFAGGTGTGIGDDRGTSAYNGSMVGENGIEPTGSVDGASTTTSTYVNSSLQKDGTVTWDITRGNLAGGISAMTLITNMSAWQYGISPAIPKTGTQTLTLNVRQTWGRH